jgi:hypothetical protein
MILGLIKPRVLAVSWFPFLLLANPSGAVECPPSGDYKIQSEIMASNVWMRWNQEEVAKCELLDNRYECGDKRFSDDFGAIYPKSSLKAYYTTRRLHSKPLMADACVKDGEAFLLINRWATQYSVDETEHKFMVLVETIERKTIKQMEF